MTPTCPIIVMAKAPIAGYAKTRLIPALGAAGAAALAERLLDHAAHQALAAGLGTVDLCCSPDFEHAAFRRLAQQPGIQLSQQADGDLGVRMARAFDRWLRSKGRALMVGTDAPGANAELLRQAAAALDRADVVLVPALDGGYALIGLNRPAPELFTDIVWSTASVMTATRRRLAASGLSHVELAPLADIDEPADLIHLPTGWLA